MQLTFPSVRSPIYIGALLLLSRARSVLFPALVESIDARRRRHIIVVRILGASSSLSSSFWGEKMRKERGKISDHLFSLLGPILWFRAWDGLHVEHLTNEPLQ